jgi:DNA-binding XRE family transcriptional regulator
MNKRFRALKDRMLADAEVRTAYEAMGAEFELASELIAARVRAGLTQSELAERMGTTQSAIARLESGRQLPSMRTLARFARATGCRPVVKLEAAE